MRPIPHLRSLYLAVCVVCLIGGGCMTGKLWKREAVVRKPAQHSLQLEKLLILSNFKIPKDHTLISELTDLRRQIAEKLRLPPQRDSVSVYLFSDRKSYQRYLDATWPGLPERRAYFVGTSRELAVYTFWGSRTLEDLRHEYTHGVLHASLNAVPLWLDEGLAEYFEVSGSESGAINKEHAYELATAMTQGWKPDIRRLEGITEFSDMQRRDYQEAWAWVHYLLQDNPETEQLLCDYLFRLRDRESAGFLSDDLEALNPRFRERFQAYAGNLHSPIAVIRAQEETGP